jgi:hypothetical protein
MKFSNSWLVRFMYVGWLWLLTLVCACALVVSSWTTLLPYGSPRGMWVCTNIWLVQVFNCAKALDALGVQEAIIRPNRSLLAILMNYSKSDYHTV